LGLQQPDSFNRLGCDKRFAEVGYCVRGFGLVQLVTYNLLLTSQLLIDEFARNF
jgi:hypothetical protein